MPLFRTGLVILCFWALSGCLPSTQDNVPAPSTVSARPNNQDFLPAIHSLMTGTENCILPCFWGLMPGSSSQSDVAQVIKSLDKNNVIQNQLNQADAYNFALFFEPEGMLLVNLATHNSVVQRMSVGLTKAYNWLPEHLFRLPEVLKSPGAPDDIFIIVSGSPPGYTLTLVYNQQGVMVRYRADFVNEAQIGLDSPLAVCPSLDSTYQIDAWIQDPDDGLVENNLPDLRDENRAVRPYWSIENINGYSIADFVRAFASNNDACVPLPSLRELKAMGYQY